MSRALTPKAFLTELHGRGAKHVERVAFRRNRSVIWSVTANGATLNVHEAFRSASPEILDAFATIARSRGHDGVRTRRARAVVRGWPKLARALGEIRAHTGRHRPRKRRVCCGTPEQRTYLENLFTIFNETRFEGLLPADLPIRLSNRMRSSLGHLRHGVLPDGTRVVVEIALNVDLMLEGNGPVRVDTLLHEMAHAADYLTTGGCGHGASWRRWARSAGCRPTRLCDRPVRRRARGERTVSRVPPLPPALRRATER